MRVSVCDLPWLSAPPADFANRCRKLADRHDSIGLEIQTLASHRLSAAQAASLGRLIARCRAQDLDIAPLSPFRLGVLAGTTFDVVSSQLPAGAARHGIALEVVTTPFDQVVQQALDPHAVIHTSKSDAILVGVESRWLQLHAPRLSVSPQEQVTAAVARLKSVVEALRRSGAASVIIQTVPVPPLSLFGSYDRRVAGTARSMIEQANGLIAQLASETGSYLLDVAGLAERIGTDRWFDPVQWLSYKMAFSTECDLAYADFVGRLLGAIRGKSRKCLVLDLDNTIWGGVIGDDGLEGIQLSQGTPIGEAFLAIQRTALDLRERGVLLAVASKNTDEVARQPFRSHPDMLLRESDIAVFQANWLDKASNLEAIAKELNIGVDALVLLDDNPAERAQVRAMLPMVAVPELPSDPAWFPWFLQTAGYFETVSFSAEDRIRAESYTSDARRAEVRAIARDVGDYLTSLSMTLTLSPFDLQGRPRIEQLINKTNQFNLTTRRYTNADLVAVQTDKRVYALQARLEDQFGDLGMISVVICRPRQEGSDSVWMIDTWLMSCRVLGRCVEVALLSTLVSAARSRAVVRLVGEYIPTAKNAMVRDHYTKLGFKLTEESPDGSCRFELEVGGYRASALPLKVVETALAPAKSELVGK